MLSVRGTQADEIWSSQDVLSSQYATSLLRDGFLYGIHGREDVGNAVLQCVDASNGELKWTEKQYGTAHLISVGDRLLMLTIKGELLQFRPNPDRFELMAKSRVSGLITRSLPALSNGRLYLRENNGSNTRLMCFEVGQ
jgi:hypothetical protein